MVTRTAQFHCMCCHLKSSLVNTDCVPGLSFSCHAHRHWPKRHRCPDLKGDIKILSRLDLCSIAGLFERLLRKLLLLQVVSLQAQCKVDQRILLIYYLQAKLPLSLQGTAGAQNNAKQLVAFARLTCCEKCFATAGIISSLDAPGGKSSISWSLRYFFRLIVCM